MQSLLRKFPIIGTILKIAAVIMCGGNPICGALVSFATSAAITGLTGGSLGQALKSGLIAAGTVIAFHLGSEAMNASGFAGGASEISYQTTTATSSTTTHLGQASHLGAGETVHTSLPGITIVQPGPTALPTVVVNSTPSAVVQAATQTVNTVVPGAHLMNLGSQSWAAGSYLYAAGFYIGGIADQILAVSTVGASTVAMPMLRNATRVATGHLHHIATNKWWQSTTGGGPWSPRFKDIFARGGMSLDDSANIVRVPGHVGPHPPEYHRMVYDRLVDAVGSKTGAAAETALRGELGRLAKDVSNPNHILNKLVTNR